MQNSLNEISFRRLLSLVELLQLETTVPELLTSSLDAFAKIFMDCKVVAIVYDPTNNLMQKYSAENGKKVSVSLDEVTSGKFDQYFETLNEETYLDARTKKGEQKRFDLIIDICGKPKATESIYIYPVSTKSQEPVGCIIFIAAADMDEENRLILKFITKIVSVCILRQTQNMRWEDEHMKLIAAGRKAALGEMAGGIAHEINNPLSVVSGQAQKLKLLQQMNKLTPEETSKSIDKILETVDRISHIITALRVFSRDDRKVEKKVSSLATIIDDSLALCAEKIKGRGVQLQVNAPTETADVYCNQVQISQVIINLISNAFDAVCESPSPWIRLTLETHSNFALLRVTDSGLGIKKEIVDQIMQPFFTTKEVGHGTGIGLSLSQGIIKAHGGELYYNSEARNTEFVVKLPLASAKSQAAS